MPEIIGGLLGLAIGVVILVLVDRLRRPHPSDPEGVGWPCTECGLVIPTHRPGCKHH